MKRIYLAYMFFTFFLITCCSGNKTQQIDTAISVQFFPRKEGLLIAIEPFEDATCEGNMISIYDSEGRLKGNQPISNSDSFRIMEWKNDTIHIALFGANMDYIRALNHNEIDYLSPTTNHQLKFFIGENCYKSKNSSNMYFDEYLIDKKTNRIQFFRNSGIIGSYELQDVFFYSDDILVSSPNLTGSLNLQPDANVSIDQIVNKVLDIYCK